MGLAVIILAAGKGSRMRSDLPKVLHKVKERPLIEYVLDASNALDPEKTILIVGHQAALVKNAAARYSVTTTLQEPQLGTGHAVMQAKTAFEHFEGEILILSGDTPLVNVQTLQHLIEFHRSVNATATVLTADLKDPAGYGRVIRHNNSDIVLKIVEHKDATEEERIVQEINSGIYVFNAPILFQTLAEITTNNTQKEYYLTDVFGICFNKNKRVVAFKTTNHNEIMGINNMKQLREVEQILLKACL
ncbi:MAG: sugar phosphate nucleotidyltransferase [Chlorobiaceae bacterium]